MLVTRRQEEYVEERDEEDRNDQRIIAEGACT
jgi:hypothetical protein